MGAMSGNFDKTEPQVRLIVQGITPREQLLDPQGIGPGEQRPDPEQMLNNLRDHQRLAGYRVVDELGGYVAKAPHTINGEQGRYVTDFGAMDLPSGHPWLAVPNIYLIETDADNVTAVMGYLYRTFANPNQPNMYIEAIEVETTLRLSLSSKLGTRFNLYATNASHADYKTDISWAKVKQSTGTITGKDTKIAVLDSGSQTARAGWHDFTDPASSVAVDSHGHGTAMADIIHDLADDAELHIMRVSQTGTLGLFDLMAALLTAIVHVQAHIVNMSLGVNSSPKPCSSCGAVGANRSTVFEHWFKALCAGAVEIPIFACAVGNDGATAPFDWPAAFADMIAVGAVTHNKFVSRFSNRGSTKTGNYLLCPGGETDASGKVTEWVGTALDGVQPTYCAGTSPATAYASALFALYRQNMKQTGGNHDSGAVIDEAIKRSLKDVKDPASGKVDPNLPRMVLDI
jgi:subtilisin family serine protease